MEVPPPTRPFQPGCELLDGADVQQQENTPGLSACRNRLSHRWFPSLYYKQSEGESETLADCFDALMLDRKSDFNDVD